MHISIHINPFNNINIPIVSDKVTPFYYKKKTDDFRSYKLFYCKKIATQKLLVETDYKENYKLFDFISFN